MPTLELNGKLFAEQSGTGSVKLKIDELTESTANAGIRLAHPLKSSAGDDIMTADGALHNINFDNVANNAIHVDKLNIPDNTISGDKVHGGTISGFSSVGISDNANSVAVIINSSGNVGIGPINPSTNLHLFAQTGDVGINVQSSVTANAKAFIQLYGRDASNVNKTWKIENDAHKLTFSDDGTPKVTIDKSGYFGIGSSSPTSAVTIRDDSSGSKVELLRLENLGGGSNEGSLIGFYSDDGKYADIETSHSTYNYGNLSLRAYDNDHSTAASEIRLSATTGTTDDPFISFTTNASERMRIDKNGVIRASGSTAGGGRIVVNNTASGDGDDSVINVAQNDYSCWDTIFAESWVGNSVGWGTFWAGNAGALYRRVSTDGNPNEYVMVGAGNKRFTFDLDSGGHAYFDGSLTQNSYDYAEYFEWEDGNLDKEDRRGYSVILTPSGKIRKAIEDDNVEDIFGVISGTAAIIGDAAIYDWNGKYLTDEWGTKIYEQVYQVSWIDEENQSHSYDEDYIPDGIIAPENASRRLHKRAVLNPDYDPNAEYVPRDQRKEWDPVGILGKVRVRDESPKNPRWTMIKIINGKKLWLIR